jgi:hypothetical protein
MDFLDQNLDAYRIIAEILNDLRSLVQETLRTKHGSEWYRTGLPESVFQRLIDVKEQEKAIDWYETEYQKIINYALFPELLEVVENDPEAFAPLFKLAPSAALLNARFLELEVMRAKLGRARPVSEAELSFLSTFHLRFRKATGDMRDAVTHSDPPADQPDEVIETEAQAAVDDTPHDAQPSTAETEVKTDASEESEPSDEAPEDESTDAQITPPPSRVSASPRVAPPRRPVQSLHTSRGATAAAAAPAEAPEIPDQDPSDDVDETPKVARGTLGQALEDSDTRAILRELYREVTSLAESIWSSDVPPGAMVWSQVRSSSWYEVNFSKLGLKPLSDFYDVFSTVESKLEDGIARDQLQDYLKEVNFAQILLAMRDMFQRNKI